MSETLGERIKRARATKNLTHTAIAWQLSTRMNQAIDSVYISRLERGEIARPGKERLTVIAEILEIPPDDLYRLADYGVKLEDVIELPVADVSAGPGAWVDEPVYLSRSRYGSRRVAAYRVRGTSMEPVILEGSTVIIDIDKPPQVGDIVVAWVDDRGVIKRVVRENDRLYLKGTNNEAILLTEQVHIAGVVVQVNISLPGG